MLISEYKNNYVLYESEDTILLIEYLRKSPKLQNYRETFFSEKHIKCFSIYKALQDLCSKALLPDDISCFSLMSSLTFYLHAYRPYRIMG